jgi:hypothetical protein
MTEQTLDRVARVLATGMPRRAVLKAAAAAAAGGVLTMVSRHEDAEARGGTCTNGLQRCGNDGCYNPTEDICCKCPGTLKGRQITRGVLLYDPPITCSTLLSCRD